MKFNSTFFLIECYSAIRLLVLMKQNLPVKPRRGLSLGPAIILCGVLFGLYKIFRTDELDRQISKLEEKNKA